MTRMSEIPPELLKEMIPAVRAFVESLLVSRNSGNSSLPPSSDGAGQQPVKQRRVKSGRKRGGQVGHPKRTRPLIPAEECDRIEHHRPTVYSGCGSKLDGDDPNPERHQVTEIPPVQPSVTEHQIHTLECPGCGGRSRGRLPPHVPHGCFGPNVVAIVTWLSSPGRLSQRIIASLLRDLFHLEVADGQISRLKTAAQELIHHWNRLQSQQIQRATFDGHDRQLHGEILDALLEGSQCDHVRTAEICRRHGKQPIRDIHQVVTAAFRGHPAPKLLPES